MVNRAGSLLFLVFFLSGCGQQFGQKLASSNEPSCGFFQSSAGYRISWGARTPVRLMVSRSWPSRYEDAVRRAIAVWNSSQSRTYISVQFNVSAAGTSPLQDGMSGLYWMNTWSESRANEQGLTTLRFKNDTTTEADIKINAKNFSYYDMDEQSHGFGSVHLDSLLIHEFGHLLGLSHIDSPERVMYPYLAPNTVREQLYSADLDDLACEYGGGS